MLVVKCQERLDAARKFADEAALAAQLQAQLDYLSGYGDGDNRCTLYSDFAPHSFTFDMERPDGAGGWRNWFSGGLILQTPSLPADGSFPSLTVSLTQGDGWFVHT